jgi:hypothetical protein
MPGLFEDLWHFFGTVSASQIHPALHGHGNIFRIRVVMQSIARRVLADAFENSRANLRVTLYTLCTLYAHAASTLHAKRTSQCSLVPLIPIKSLQDFCALGVVVNDSISDVRIEVVHHDLTFRRLGQNSCRVLRIA